MKYIITENQSDEVFSRLLKSLNIKYVINYQSDNGFDSITAAVYLYKNGIPSGYYQGYEFYFNYDSRFNKLIPNGSYPKIEVTKIFSSIPSEMVVKFFVDKTQDYLKKFIDDGYSTLRRK
jgi:hypothetical protein